MHITIWANQLTKYTQTQHLKIQKIGEQYLKNPSTRKKNRRTRNLFKSSSQQPRNLKPKHNPAPKNPRRANGSNLNSALQHPNAPKPLQNNPNFPLQILIQKHSQPASPSAIPQNNNRYAPIPNQTPNPQSPL